MPHLAAYRLHLADMRWELVKQVESHRMFEIVVEETGCDFAGPGADFFRPRHVPHTWLLTEDRGWSVHHIDIHGVRIKFSDMHMSVQMHVEGELPREVVDTLVAEVLANLNANGTSKWRLRKTEVTPDP
ncbi:MAG: hypothetical protein L6Q35_09770 [Phycisphaerales bacterium]|nr:hypothetical protein [Phycisphaerales bacterium]